MAGEVQGDAAGVTPVTFSVEPGQVKLDDLPVSLEPQYLMFFVILCVVFRPTRLEAAALTEVQVNTV